MDGWYYRTLDIEFGPVTHEKLVELIQARSLSRDDEVRFGVKGGWRRVGSIGTLMAHLPFEDLSLSKSKRTARGGIEGAPFSTAVLEPPTRSFPSPEAATPKPDGNNWWCRIQDEVFGPIDMEKLVDLAKSHVVSRDDQVRFGENGIWRRVGSIGPLMAHLPFESKEQVVLKNPRTGPSDAQIETVDDGSAGTSPPDNGSREIEDRWWCRIENKEYGPIELAKVVEWAATGRLLKSDEVRFGRDPYMAAGELAGLFPEEPKPTAVASPTPPPPKPEPKKPEAAAATPNEPTPASSESSPKPASSTPSAASSGFNSPNTSSQRPAVPFRPPAGKMNMKSGGGGLVAKLIPIGIGIGALVGVGVLIYVGIMMIPESTVPDQNRLKTLTAAIDQLNNVRRSGGKKPGDFDAVKEVMAKAAKSVIAELKEIPNKKPYQSKMNYVAKKIKDLSESKIAEKPDETESTIATSLKGLEEALKPK